MTQKMTFGLVPKVVFYACMSDRAKVRARFFFSASINV